MSKLHSRQIFFTQVRAYIHIHILILSWGQKPLTIHMVWVTFRRKHGLSYSLMWAKGTPQPALRIGRAHSHRIHNPSFTSAMSALVPFQKLSGGCRLQFMGHLSLDPPTTEWLHHAVIEVSASTDRNAQSWATVYTRLYPVASAKSSGCFVRPVSDASLPKSNTTCQLWRVNEIRER